MTYSRFLLLICLSLFAGNSLCFGQDDKSPLTADELREVLTDLVELAGARERVALQQEVLRQQEELATRERALTQKEIELERSRTIIAERERDTEKLRGDQLDALLKVRDRGVSFGCVLKRIFTFGLGRC